MSTVSFLATILLLVLFFLATTSSVDCANNKKRSSILSNLNDVPTSPTSTTASPTFTCMGIDDQPIQCPSDLECCGAGTMFPSCMNSTIDKCCTWWIAATQCALNEDCCGSQGTGASSAAFCCKHDTTCCRTEEDGESACCTSDEICCIGWNSICCPKDGSCCQDSCCNPGQTCCGAVCCDDATQHCDNASHTCQWNTQYPTYSPNHHYTSFDLMWHLNGSRFGSNVLSISSSATADFIAFGDYDNPTFSRVNGHTGEISWTVKIDTPQSHHYNLQNLIVNEGSSVVFIRGLGYDLTSGKFLYNTSKQYDAACRGEAGQLQYQTASVMSISCWDSNSMSWILLAASPRTGAIINTFTPAKNFQGSSDTTISAATKLMRTIAISTPDQNPKANGRTAIIGVDVLSAKQIFVQEDIDFSKMWDANLVSPLTSQNQGYMGTSITPSSQAINVFFVQQSTSIYGLSSSTGKLLWKLNQTTYPWTSVLPFPIPSSSSSSHNLLREKQKKKQTTSSSSSQTTSSSLFYFAITNDNNYLEIRDQISGELLWTSPRNFTVQGNQGMTLGSSNNFIWGRSLNDVFAVEISSSSSSSMFQLKWVNSKLLPEDYAVSFFTTPESSFLFAQSQSHLKVLSPTDGTVVHAWPLLPQERVSGVFVDIQKSIIRVSTSSGVNTYKM